MWDSQDGPVIFRGATGTLIAQNIFEIMRLLEMGKAKGDDPVSGIPAFDVHTHGQKLLLLYQVGKPLLCERSEIPPHLWFIDATAATIIQHLRFRVIEEIEQGSTEARSAIIAAYEECYSTEVHCLSADDELFLLWESVIDRLEAILVPKPDYLHWRHLGHLSPEERLKELSEQKIDPSYFNGNVYQPKEEEINRIAKALHAICEEASMQYAP